MGDASGPWGALPGESLWYGEVIVGRNIPGGTETDYQYDYSQQIAAPDVTLLVPEGWELLQSQLNKTPRHPDYVAGEAHE